MSNTHTRFARVSACTVSTRFACVRNIYLFTFFTEQVLSVVRLPQSVRVSIVEQCLPFPW